MNRMEVNLNLLLQAVDEFHKAVGTNASPAMDELFRIAYLGSETLKEHGELELVSNQHIWRVYQIWTPLKQNEVGRGDPMTRERADQYAVTYSREHLTAISANGVGVAAYYLFGKRVTEECALRWLRHMNTGEEFILNREQDWIETLE